MSRRRGYVSYAIARQREAERIMRAQIQASREIERQQKQQQRARLASDKERLRIYHETKNEDAEARNLQLAETITHLGNVLSESIGVDHRLPFERLKSVPKKPPFEPGVLGQIEGAPQRESYLPKPLGFFASLIPGAKAKYAFAVREARARFDTDVAGHAERENSRQVALNAALSEHQAKLRKLDEATVRQHQEIDSLKTGYENGEKESVRAYCDAVLSSQSFSENWSQSFKLAYVPESKQIVVEYDFPTFDIIPTIAAYRYVRAKKETVTTPRSDADRRHLYSSLIAQTTLRVIHVLFNADYLGHLESMVFNGHVDAIDEATGHPVHPCLITLRCTLGVFEQLDLSRIDPESCLKGLNASVSKRPTELAPVKPVLEFSMVDPRFVKEEDIISGLDNRTNLMDLDPREFESLITNLFQKMGLETRQTRPSRDGGVDCVAYDPRPIFGGKVVIQAKRYKNTVGVSAVRDLYGTVQNEGASKGILVTTSGYGRSSFEFASGKPLELLDGSNLLYLLAENAGIEAKIEMPDDWEDPSPILSE
jgi:restriction system protein